MLGSGGEEGRGREGGREGGRGRKRRGGGGTEWQVYTGTLGVQFPYLEVWQHTGNACISERVVTQVNGVYQCWVML